MQGLEYATVLYCVVEAIVFCFFSMKVRIVKLVSVNEDFVSAMTLLSEEDESSVAMERLVCSLYQVKLEIDVNEATYKLLTKKKKLLRCQFLLPTKDALHLHNEHDNYQCQLWKKALDYYPHLPHPVGHG